MDPLLQPDVENVTVNRFTGVDTEGLKRDLQRYANNSYESVDNPRISLQDIDANDNMSSHQNLLNMEISTNAILNVCIGCNETYTGDSGEINVRVNITEMTSDLWICRVYIVVDHTKSISLTIDEINAKSYVDLLYIYNGNEKRDSTTRTFNMFDNITYENIKWIDDEAFQCNRTYIGDSGDISLVQQASELTIPLICYWSISVATNMSCGLELTERQGIIHSPGYPNGYYNKINCEWKIRVPKNHTIILHFIDFQTEDSDHLEIDPNVTFLVSAYNVLLKVHSNHVKTIAMNGDRVSALLDYNLKDDRIVWFDPQKHKFILKSIESTVDMSDEIDVVGQPNSLLLDWVNDLLYWIDIKSKTIKVLHFKDTESVYTVCDIKTENPRDLVINVVKGVLVWSNIGFEANLMQTHLDGIDYQTQRYYFIDINDHSLYSIDFDGNNETFILKSKELFDEIHSISIFNNDLIPELDLQLNRAHTSIGESLLILKLWIHYYNQTSKILKRDLQRYANNSRESVDNPRISLQDIDANDNMSSHQNLLNGEITEFN
ncbi:unnamed protein product [Oppiella nova]|uniref:CUB domain-containing protein n=1 Tax=Oppiella nova TaxID=334625 RepID=A0A7R9LEN1_9ACAR|nr:unnamed protein product [Oppiella nova]CAG2162078.1 unnamed protein product [Oppiella nova]